MKLFVLSALIILGNAIFAQESTPFVIGETRETGSLILDETRILNIYLPPNYSVEDTTHYPVIYLLDGSADEDFIHVSGILQYCNFPWINFEPNAILVGIANVDRRRDFTFPTTVAADKENNPTSGGSANFMACLESELIPYIDQSFRTTGERTIIGQSLGGLMCTQILFEKPALFSRYVIISPSVWWDNNSILTKPFNSELLRNKSVYLAVGKEGKVMVNGAKKLHSMLKKTGTLKRLEFEYFPGDNHATMGHIPVLNAFRKI